MTLELDVVEARVLGCLMEKESTTPEYYPLTLNALVNACNQKSNREPVVSYEDDDVLDALERLRTRGLGTELTGGSNRVPKYGHRGAETLNLGRRESALLCTLLLRGPQTVGELHGRSERMHHFSDLEEVESVLRKLMEREPPLVTALPKQPGTKEPRWAHLLSGQPVTAAGEPAREERTPRANLEAEVAELRERVATIEAQFIEFRRQFE